MPTKSTRRLSPAEIAADEAVIVAIRSLEGYNSVAGMPTLEALEALNDKVTAKQEAEQTALTKAATARDSAVSVEWERHEAVIRTKLQVIAQYGRDSDEVKAIGMKRQRDRKRPTRRTTATP